MWSKIPCSGGGGEKDVVRGELLGPLGGMGGSGDIALGPIIRVSMALGAQVKACALRSRNVDSSPW